MRSQLPAYSPLTLRGVASACGLAAIRPLVAHERLEAQLRSTFHAEGVLTTGSGTQALQVALGLAAADRGGAPVALPAYSCFDVVSAAVGAGVSVVFYDVDGVTLAPNLSSVRAALSGGARTLVAGYLFGYPLDWHAIREECRRVGAVLIEDAAQGIGTSWDGLAAGCHGDLSVLSFGRGKGWTGGLGGALLARDARWDGPLKEIRGAMDAPSVLSGAKAAGLVWAQWLLGRPSLYSLVTRLPGARLGETVYKAPVAPRRIAALSSAVVLAHASAAQAEATARRRNAATWATLLAGGPAIAARASLCTPVDPDRCGFLRFPLLLDVEGAAEAIVRRAAHLGVSRAYPLALPELEEVTPQVRNSDGDFPGAQRLARSLVGLPTHSLMRREDFTKLLRALVACLPGAEDRAGGVVA